MQQCVVTDRVASSRASSSGLSVGCTAVVCGLRAASKPARCYAPVFHQSQHRQQTSVATCAYAASPSLGLPNMSSPPRQSLDPMAAAWEQDWEPGRLLTVKSPEQFAALHSDHPDKLIVLMCKSHACRPCKMFTRKYLSVAQRFPDCILAEIYGDETPDTRKMMMKMDVRVTPTFRMYRQGDCVNVVTGTNEKKLMRGILSAMTAAELAAHEQEIADTMSFDEAEQPVAAASASSS